MDCFCVCVIIGTMKGHLIFHLPTSCTRKVLESQQDSKRDGAKISSSCYCIMGSVVFSWSGYFGFLGCSTSNDHWWRLSPCHFGRLVSSS